ncbi:MAG: hypothetical protein V1684_00440 [bacterium]
MNANSVENPNSWNAGNQVFFSNYCFPPAGKAGVLFKSPFLQPPSIRPISSNFWERSKYLSAGINLLSHANWTKNFRISRRDMVFVSRTIFCSGGKYEEAKLNSRTSMNT